MRSRKLIQNLTLPVLTGAAITAGLVGNGGCGTSTGNPAKEPRIDFAVQGTKPTSAAAARFSMLEMFRDVDVMSAFRRSAALVTSVDVPVIDPSGTQVGTLTLTDARLGLSEIKFEREGDSDGGDSEFKGPYMVNLITDVATPSFDTVKVAAGTYKKVKMKLDKIEEGEDAESVGLDSSDALYNNSIYLAGTYTGTASSGQVTGIPFSLTFDFDEEFELGSSAAKGFALKDGDQASVIVAFRIPDWFKLDNSSSNGDGLAFSDVVVSDGSIKLDLESSSETNKKLTEVIKESIKNSADYGEDSDGNGELGDDEGDESDSGS